MNITMISPYSPRKVTGVGTSIIDLCRKLKSNGVGFSLYVHSVPGNLPLDRTFEPGRDFFEAPYPERSWLSGLSIILYQTRSILKNRRRIDVVHLFSIKSVTAAGAVIARILNKPVVSTVYIIPPAPGSYDRRLVNAVVTRLILGLTDRFAYETYVARQQCGYRPGMIIPEGIDVNHFRPDKKLKREMRRKFDIPDNSFVLLYSGRLVEIKGIVELLSAVRSLPGQVLQDFKLVIIGNVETARIKKELKIVKDEPWLIHIPPVERDEIKNYYCMADAFVLPSYYEGISSSLIEAMACELPPIVTGVGGNTEVVKHNRNGLVVKVKDITGLRAGIERIVMDKKLCSVFAGRARKTVVEGFSLEKKAANYMRLYEQVIREQVG